MRLLGMQVLTRAMLAVPLTPKAAPCRIRMISMEETSGTRAYPTAERAMTPVARTQIHFLLKRSAAAPAKGRTQRAVMENMPAMRPDMVNPAPREFWEYSTIIVYTMLKPIAVIKLTRIKNRN